MIPVSVYFVVPALVLALVTCWLIIKFAGSPLSSGRFATIDGVRGYLAFFVFLHHGSVWAQYLHTGKWASPSSSLFTQFGQGSVALFFMITGFLFYTKLLDSRGRSVDWLRFFVGRVLRLVPLHWFAVSIMFVIVMILSRGEILDPVKTFTGLLRWLTLLGSPDLNAVVGTTHILAGVTWSLPYEWFFYLSLPIIALSVALIAPFPVLFVGFAAVIGAIAWHADPLNAFQFLGGITAAILVRYKFLSRIATSVIGSPLVIALLLVEIGLFATAYGFAQVIILSVVFALIAGGSSLFGLLTWRVSHTLGEMAYSIYLLHGVVLFVTFRFVLGFEAARALAPVEYWLVVCLTVPVLLLMCFVTFRLIERPAMDRAGALTARIRNFFNLKSYLRAPNDA